MQPHVLSCTGISKDFKRSIVPLNHLQDSLLKRYISKQQWHVRALDDASLTVGSGEWVGLYGANGSGKTTFLRVAAGLMRADSGTVTQTGTLSCFLGLGTGFHPERTARENIVFHHLLHGISRKKTEQLVDTVIAFAGTESHKDLPLKCYSTGMQLRLAFSAAVHADADLYMFDELIAVGDSAFQVQCEQKLEELKHAGKSAILVSHNMDQLTRLCDRVCEMKQGKLEHSALVA